MNLALGAVIGGLLLVGAAIGAVAYIVIKRAPGQPKQRPGRRLRDGPHPTFSNVVDVGGGATRCWFDIVGESSYQGTLRTVAGGRLLRDEEVRVQCLIAPEPDNPVDSQAMAVYIEGGGKVGYFSRDDLAGYYGGLRDRLRHEKAAGRCTGMLTGGWDEEVSIGVRLALMRPSELETQAPQSEPAPPPPRLAAPGDWAARRRLELPAGKVWLNLVQEHLCQEALAQLAEGRDVTRETVGFRAVLLVDAGAVVVCAEGADTVGRMGRSDVARYSDLVAMLETERLAATCGGWVIREGDQLGARITIKSPKALMKELQARGGGAP